MSEKNYQPVTDILNPRDLHHCLCCTPSRRTLVIGQDRNGYDMFQCPHTKQIVKYVPAARQYLPGRQIIPGLPIG